MTNPGEERPLGSYRWLAFAGQGEIKNLRRAEGCGFFQVQLDSVLTTTFSCLDF
jgi:hypothetical protein